MKKLVVLAMAIGFSFATFAQDAPKKEKKEAKKEVKKEEKKETKEKKDTKKDVPKVPVKN